MFCYGDLGREQLYSGIKVQSGSKPPLLFFKHSKASGDEESVKHAVPENHVFSWYAYSLKYIVAIY